MLSYGTHWQYCTRRVGGTQARGPHLAVPRPLAYLSDNDQGLIPCFQSGARPPRRCAPMTTAHTATAPTPLSTTGSPPGESCIMVIFGAGGDLTKRLLMPALYNLQCDGLLPSHFALIGFDFKEITTDDF